MPRRNYTPAATLTEQKSYERLNTLLSTLLEHDAEVHENITAVQRSLKLLSSTGSLLPTNGYNPAHAARAENLRKAREAKAQKLIATHTGGGFLRIEQERPEESANPELPPKPKKTPNASSVAALGILRHAPEEAISRNQKGKARGLKKEWVLEQLRHMPEFKKQFAAKQAIAELSRHGIPDSYIKHGLYPTLSLLHREGLLKKIGNGLYRGA